MDIFPTRGEPAGRRLGWFLLAWLGLVVAAIVLAPFAFEPSRLADAAWQPLRATEPRDLVLNVVLFLPLGFLFDRVQGGRWSPMAIVLLSATVSLVIESAQLMLPGRYSALSDVLANGVGGGLGALGSSYVRRRIGTGGALASRFFLDLPLVSLAWMLVPLAWLLAIEGLRATDRLALLLPVAAAGSVALAAAGRSGGATLTEQRTPPLARTGIAWWGVAFLPTLVTHPLWGGGAALVFGGIGLLADRFWRYRRKSDRRLEPWAVGIVLVMLMPWFLFSPPSRGSLAWQEGGEATRIATLAVVQIVVGYATLGFAVAEWLGRARHGLWSGLLVTLGLTSILTMAWHRETDPSRLLLLFAAAAGGTVLYRRQRADIIALIREHSHEQSHVHN